MEKLSAALAVVFTAITLYALAMRISNRHLPASLPPGPRGIPLLGNVFDMPSSKEWITFEQWGRRFGDIVHVKVLGQHMIILNSTKIAADMLDKKSLIYSDRPVLTMAGELTGWKNGLALSPYGDQFRTYRKMFHKLVGTTEGMSKFQSVQDTEVRRFLHRVMNEPARLVQHIRHTAGAAILMLAYGYKVQDKSDPVVELVETAMAQFSFLTSTVWLVDVIPALRFIPSWVPGARFKTIAPVWGKALADMVDVPFMFTKEQMASGTAIPSFTSDLLETHGTGYKQEFDVKWSAANVYSGGSETLVSAITSFFLAMLLYPEVQKTAQAELDTVVGTDRLPTFSDRESLPYLEALVKEVHRWSGVAPTSLPHRVSKDDIHDGFLIPRGSLIITNIQFMLRDPRTYTNPQAFEPNRFLGCAPEEDPRNIAFGFGRRVCPGSSFADGSVFLTCAMALAVFNISKALENGRVVEPVVEKLSGTISHLAPFKYNVQPRSAKAASLILAAHQEIDGES